MEIIEPRNATRRGIGEKQGYRPVAVRDETYHCPVMGPGRNKMVLCFLPSPEELQRLFAGEPLRISIIGNAPPPIMVDVGL